MDENILAKMRSRVERCRRLAREILDERAAKILNDMADEGEADIARLTAEQNATQSSLPPSNESPRTLQ